jgi:hypothetical protein
MYGRSWPKAPVDAPGLNDRFRDIAANWWHQVERRQGVDNGLSLITRMIVSSQGIAGKAWRNSAVSGGTTRVFPSDTILAALGDVSSNPSIRAVLVSVYNQHTTHGSGQQLAESAAKYIKSRMRNPVSCLASRLMSAQDW